MIIDSDEIARRLTAAVEYQGSPAESATIAQCAHDAAMLTGSYIGSLAVPQEVANYAATEVARELHTRLGAPGGVLSSFAEAAPVRLARDPLTAAYPILAPYLGGGFA